MVVVGKTSLNLPAKECIGCVVVTREDIERNAPGAFQVVREPEGKRQVHFHADYSTGASRRFRTAHQMDQSAGAPQQQHRQARSRGDRPGRSSIPGIVSSPKTLARKS